MATSVPALSPYARLFLGRRSALQPALLTDADFAKLRREGLGEPELVELVAFGGALALLIAVSRSLNCISLTS